MTLRTSRSISAHEFRVARLPLRSIAPSPHEWIVDDAEEFGEEVHLTSLRSELPKPDASSTEHPRRQQLL